jgi:hypothetical protein
MLVGNMQYYLDCYYGTPELAKVVRMLMHTNKHTLHAQANAQLNTYRRCNTLSPALVII